LVVALGIILAAAGPVLVLVLNSRNKVRQYVYGTARVADISPRPTTDGRTARGRLKLVVRATGVNGVTVSTVDPAIPLDKWPDPGATLPVQVLKGNPRKLAVVWDKVQSHQDAQASERRPSSGGAPPYSVDGDQLDVVDSPTDDYERRRDRASLQAGSPAGSRSGLQGGSQGGLQGGSNASFERPAADLPPDDRPTLTDLPPVTAPVVEPVRLSGRGDRPGQTRPASRPTSPAPTPTPATPAPTTPAPTSPGPSSPGPASSAAGPDVTAQGFHAPAAVAFADPESEARSAHTGVVTEDTPPLVVRLPSSPVRGGRRRPSPRPRPGTHDRGPARAAEPVPTEETPAAVTAEETTAAAPAEQAPAAVTAEETPAAVTSAPSYTIPEAGPSLSPPPDLPTFDYPEPEPVADPPAAVPLTKAAPVTETAAGQEVETAVEGGVDRPGGEPMGTAALPSGITWWPDRETEQLPTRLPRLEHTAAATDAPTDAPTDAGTDAVQAGPSEGRTAQHRLADDADDADDQAADQAGADQAADTQAADTQAGADPAANAGTPVVPATPLRSANEAAVDAAGNGAAPGRPWGAVDASGPTTSAWSSNGHSRETSPTWPRPAAPPATTAATAATADEDEAPAAPSPYATEHYVGDPADDPAADQLEDQLEEQPPSEGAVGQFLATEQRQQSMPLDGVNGVSITLIVSDLERSRRFYRDTLGLTELDSGDTAAVLATGDARVVLRRVADMPPVDRRVVHLNLEVPDVYEAYERLREQGVDFVHRPRVVPQGEQLELCSATFRDPDGHAIALTKWELRR
jgi:catechol 2,3-dioxygenase-like lactoylglutathione lyase family enzyme